MSLDPRLLAQSIARLKLDLRARIIEQVGSTNSELAAKARRGELDEREVLIAIEQSAGRGRRGRSWISDPETGLTFSYGYRAPDRIAIRAPGLIALSAGVALAETILRIGADRARFGLKYPNDLLVDRRKAAGILAELLGAPDGSKIAIVGIGVNVNRALEVEGKESAALIELFDRREPIERESFVALFFSIEKELRRLLVAGQLKAIMDRYRSFDLTVGETIETLRAGSLVRGRAESIDDDGALLWRRFDDDRIERSVSGEIFFAPEN